MAEQLTVLYEEIPITYSERDDEWLFQLRGRDRRAGSLAKAKEAIDKPVPADKTKPFERIPAIEVDRWGAAYKFGEVTSIADTQNYKGVHDVWFVSDGNQRKLSPSNLAADNPENRALIAEAVALKKQSDQILESMKGKAANLAPFTVALPE